MITFALSIDYGFANKISTGEINFSRGYLKRRLLGQEATHKVREL